MAKSSPVIAAIELGSSKVAVAVGLQSQAKHMELLALCQKPSSGIQKGAVVDYKAAYSSLHDCLELAESQAQTPLKVAYLSQTGTHLIETTNEACINVRASDNVVGEEDIAHANSEAKTKQLPSGRVYIHHMHKGFILDGRPLENPFGERGKQLRAEYWSIHGNRETIRTQISLVNQFGLRTGLLVVSSVASLAPWLQEEHKKQGVLAIDIGAETTDFCIYKNGHIVQTGVFPVGGEHITQDICLGLRLEKDAAEWLKRTHLDLQAPNADRNSFIEDKKILGERTISTRTLAIIARARLEEIFTLISERIERYIRPAELSAGIFLSGGSTRLVGVENVAQKVFTNLTVQSPWKQTASNVAPELSVVLGMLQCSLAHNLHPQFTNDARESKKPLLTRLSSLLK